MPRTFHGDRFVSTSSPGVAVRRPPLKVSYTSSIYSTRKFGVVTVIGNDVAMDTDVGAPVAVLELPFIRQ
jgi:hypothetical protein